MEYKTINDIEIKYSCVFTETLKTEQVAKVFLEVFNKNELINIDPDLNVELEIDFGIFLQIIGLYHKFVKKDFETARKYFIKSGERGNYYSYLSLSTITDNKEEKLNYILKSYEHDNNISAIVNLGLYYMYDVVDEEKMFYYTNMAIEKKSSEAMNNIGVYYVNKKDYENAIKYFKMAINNGFKAYYNLFVCAIETRNAKLVSKCEFYLALFLPEKIIEHYTNTLIDTEEKETLCKMQFYKMTHNSSLDAFLEYKNAINNYATTMINFYKKCKENKYLPNTNLLIGDLIDKKKLAELAELSTKQSKIEETIQLTNGAELIFCYEKN